MPDGPILSWAKQFVDRSPRHFRFMLILLYVPCILFSATEEALKEAVDFHRDIKKAYLRGRR